VPLIVAVVWANPWHVSKVERKSLAVCFEKICHRLRAKPENESVERLDTFICRVALPCAPSRKRTVAPQIQIEVIASVIGNNPRRHLSPPSQKRSETP
jgi:hypothetical protein